MVNEDRAGPIVALRPTTEKGPHASQREVPSSCPKKPSLCKFDDAHTGTASRLFGSGQFVERLCDEVAHLPQILAANERVELLND